MGNRTLVLLYNDQASDWERDTELGRKIAIAMNYAHRKDADRARLEGYGKVVECAHADTQTLAIVDSYNFTPLAHGHWFQGQTPDELRLKLLKEAADQMGFRLVRKS